MDKIEKIIWTDAGIKSFEEVVQYISNDSEYYASNFARKLLLLIENLKIFPRSGRIVPEYNNPDIRELIYQNYRIVYTISGKAVYIALVIHGTKNLLEII
jgi:plasmid stabilization system protein ParE